MWNWFRNLFAGRDLSSVDGVLRETAKACGYLPKIQTVLSIFAAGNPALNTPIAIATAICNALHTRSTVGLMRSPPEVEGVPIEGDWIKRHG